MAPLASRAGPGISATRTTATPQFALDERSLFRAGDSSDLAKKIDYWFEHEKERREMEVRYAEHAKKYALENCVLQMEEMFSDAIRKNDIEKNR